MTETHHVIETNEYEEVPEEVVETSYMCGECYQLFPSTENFNRHTCQETEVVSQEDQHHEPIPSTPDVTTEVWEAGESEAAMEEAVASILGERMKLTSAPQRSETTDLKRTIIISEENAIQHHIEPALQTQGETVHIEIARHIDGVEIPSTNLYVYDNASYLHKLMKDNSFGRRLRHDAPYTQRLGPWDNKSSRYLIQLLKEYPKAFFILDKEMKRTEAWEIIRHRLAEAGYQFTVLQIRMRWRELCKKYRNTVNHNDMYNTKKTCQYYEDLNNLFGIWDKGATLLLISQLNSNCRKSLGQNGGTRMRIRVWEHIAHVLEAHGYQYTPDQVQGRWSNLVTLYQRMVEHNSKPDNEPITVAYKEHIERIFNYVPERNSKWLKIMEKRGKTPKPLAKRWTLPAERILLAAYQERVYRFNNEHVSNTDLWQEIVQKLQDEGCNYSMDKVRTRFYELTKQFSTTEHHNSQPGTIRRECRHHSTLTQIYSIYNYWPHDRSTIKLENSNAVRMRQVNAQLSWTYNQSKTLLELYPQVLLTHLSTGEHQPAEELWLQLAKAFLKSTNEKKQCYELEEHLLLLRRGYHSQNPFPFMTEMQLLEETESTLGFLGGQLKMKEELSAIIKHQLVPYWSHTAAHLLLDLVIHHRQEGVKNTSLFEIISADMANYSYRYTGEECRTYYTLLRQLYNNRVRTIKRNKELLKPFPYMEKMAEVDSITSQPKFIETEENQRLIMLEAKENLDSLKLESDGCGCGRDHLVSWLTNLKMSLKRAGLQPPPHIKNLARVILAAIESPSDEGLSAKIGAVLGPCFKALHSIAERGGSYVVYQPGVSKNKPRKPSTKSTLHHKYSSVQWTDNNLKTMMDTIMEWKLICHDHAEFESILLNTDGLWKDVASRIGEHNTKVDPSKCQERFNQVCREYRSVMSFNARLGSEDGVKSVPFQEILEKILSPHICHEAELDVRDLWWANEEENGEWPWIETVELIFTVRELWPSFPKDGWEMVSSLMKSSGYQRGSVECQENFNELYNGYQSAVQHNRNCNLKTRRRPRFYYKIHTLFSDVQPTPPLNIKMNGSYDIEVEESILFRTLVGGLRQLKRHKCHIVPRIPLLLALAQHLNSSFQCSPPIFTPFKVWQLMVQLHQSHMGDYEKGNEVPEDLEDLWEKHSNPLVAYGLQAQAHSGWQQVNEWCAEEVFLLLEGISSRELQPRSSDTASMNIPTTVSNHLKSNGFIKTPMQCQDQWVYMVSTFRAGGYRQFINNLRLIAILSPSLVQPHHSTSSFHCDKHNQKIETVKVEDKEKNVKPPAKKLKVDMNAMVPVSKENRERRKPKPNAPGDVTSYVQINVPGKRKPGQRNVQVATDEPEEIFETALNIKEEPEEVTLSISAEDSSKCVENISEEYLVSEQELSEPINCESVHESNMSESSPQGENIQVEIINVEEAENSKIVECRTVLVDPERTIKLHYPSDHSFTIGMKYLSIPKSMVFPDSKKSSKTSLHTVEIVNSNSSRVLNEVTEENAIIEPRHKVNENMLGPEKREVLNLLMNYRNTREANEKKWHGSLHTSYKQHTSLLKKIVGLFSEFQDEIYE